MTKKYNKKWVIAAMTLGVIIFLTIALILFLFQKQDTSDSASIPPLYPGVEWEKITNSTDVYYTSLVAVDELDPIISYYQNQLKTMKWEGGKSPVMQNNGQTQLVGGEYVYIKLKYPKLQSASFPEGICRSLITCEGIRYFSLSYEYSTQDNHSDASLVTIEYN